MAKGQRPRLAAAIGKQQPTEAPEPAAAEKLRAGGKTIGFSLRLDEAAHEQLRRMAFDSRRSIHALVIEALNDLFAKHGKPPVA